MERTWQFQFRGDDTCQGCTTDALKQKSIVWKVRLHYWTKFWGTYMEESGGDAFFHIVQAYHTAHRRQCPFHCIQVFPVLVRKAKARRPTLSSTQNPCLEQQIIILVQKAPVCRSQLCLPGMLPALEFWLMTIRSVTHVCRAALSIRFSSVKAFVSSSNFSFSSSIS